MRLEGSTLAGAETKRGVSCCGKPGSGKGVLPNRG